MLTKLLHACGLELGPESDLMPARPDNPDGFWEHLRFVGLNDELLSQLGGAWDLPPPRDQDLRDSRFAPLRLKAESLVQEFVPNTLWGWKDPRNCLTLPFWKSILRDFKTIVIVRNPLEVAHSMRERNGNSYSFGLRLWEIYNRRLIETTSASDRLLTHYDFFFDNAEAELRRITRFVGLPDRSISTAANMVATNRRHTHFTIEQMIDAGVSANVIDFYRDLVAEAESRTRVPSDGYTRDEREAEDLLPGSVSRLDASLPEREAKLRELVLQLAQQDSCMREMEGAISSRENRIREMEGAISSRDSRIREMEETISKIRERFFQTNHLLHERSIRLADTEARSGILREQLRKQLQATKKLLRFLQQTEDAAKHLRESRRWKAANPISWLTTLLTKSEAPGFGHLDKVVQAYHHWRPAHPETEQIDDRIQALTPGAGPSPLASLLSNADQIEKCKPSIPRGPIEFPVCEDVEISIIVPVFDQCHFTQACLASVQSHQDGIRLEVIVVDDCSSDATAELMAGISGLVYLRNESNSGFIASCNRGAEKARGKYLVFLNNDTIVTPGWLGTLRETFEIEPEAGIVGSKLVFPDGRLQEAGGIIWRDASGWNRGKFQNADDPQYNYMREVDYCSAASLMIPKALFQSLGSFDCKYAPGYYEDTDLAFKVCAAGLKVLYQPLSKVIHYEGATGGTDLSAGAKQFQVSNRTTFAAAWTTVLAAKPVNGDLATFEAPKPGQRRILVIDHHLPMPDRDSGSLRMSQILNILRELGHRVTFLPDNLADIPPYADDLRKRGIEVVHHPHIKSVRQYLETHGTQFDLVILSRCDFARKHMSDVRQYAPQSRIIFDTVDLHFLRDERQAELTKDSKLEEKAAETRKLEYELIDKADETWVVSTAEQKLLSHERPAKAIHVVSNIVDIPGSTTPFSLRRDFLFIGSFQHTPNIDGVLFFAHDILPLVWQELGLVKFYIIGEKAPPEILALADEHVIVTGLQPDVRPYFDAVKLSVAALRYGAGVKGKINQSMGFGVPVVATSIAVEGMDLTDRANVLIGDLPEDFARALIELYTSQPLWEKISEAGLEKTRALFSREVAEKQLRQLFSDDQPANLLESTGATAFQPLAPV